MVNMDTSELTATQIHILDLIDSEPGMSNAEIAEETGKHTALVRDLRKQEQLAAEREADDSGGSSVSEPTSILDTLSGTQVSVLQRAAKDPDQTNAELAAATDTHTALVRDLRSDVQAEILAHTLRNPEATNAELAAELGTHTALVRDARSGIKAEILER